MYNRPILAQKRPAPRKSDLKKFAAPTAGWISNRNLASPITQDGSQGQGAARLDNFFPTSTTALLRRGKELYATLGAGDKDVTSLFTYVNGLNRKLFSSNENSIYDITNVEIPYNYRIVDSNEDYIVNSDGDYFGSMSTMGRATLTGATGGDWSTIQFATSGGVYLLGVNGSSTGFVYDGNGMYPYVKGGVWTVSYDNIVTEFTVGEIVTGSQSGATGTVFEVLNGALILSGVEYTDALSTLPFRDATGLFTVGLTITGDNTRAFGTVTAVNAEASYDLNYYRQVTSIPNGATIVGSLSGATAEVISNTVGPTQWRLKVDYGTSLFRPDELITGQTSNAKGKLLRFEDYQVEYELEYSTGTSAFASGTIITGTTSNARAEIVSVDGTTAAGKLILKDLYGLFQTGEIITGDAGGSATTVGTAVGAYSSGALILEEVTGTFQNNEIVKGASQGSASVNGTIVGPFVSGTLRLKDIDGDFVYNDVLTGTPTGEAVAVTKQSSAIYSGDVTLSNVSGQFSGGEGITGASIKGFATSDSVYVSGGNFRNDEMLTGSLGGDAQAASAAVNLVPGIVFPDVLTSADMSYIWVFRNRIWFVQRDSLNIWYMDAVDAVGGEPRLYPMGGIFTKGGSVTWGNSWSFESGAAGGLSDQMVVTSTEGEVAVFQGDYPEGSWQVVGTYQIGTPLGKRAYFRGGGDIAVATSVGLVPLSKAISLDVNALSPATVSYNIQDAWQNAIEERGLADWQCEIWPESKMAVISPPSPIGSSDPVLFISNTETGAWCRYTNWDARAMCVFQGELYFGGANGEVFKANETGTDNGEVYTGVYIPLFDDVGFPANRKVPKMGRGKTRSKGRTNESVRFKADFDIEPGAAPSATPVDGGNTWGQGIWGQSVWGATLPGIISSNWRSVGGSGYYMSMCYQVTSGSMVPLDVEIIDLEITFTMGEMVT